MRYLFVLFLAAISLQACNQEQKGQQTDTPATQPAPALATLPGIPMEMLKNLWDNCDGMDYVFYNLPISMSLDNQPSIQNALSQIAEKPAAVLPQCKSIGRIFFMIEGENILMAELYFAPECTYFVFLQDDKPAYANYMTSHGVQYFNDVFKQAGITPDQIK